VDADGGNLRRLASGSLGNGFNAAKTLVWSPDGRYLATVFHVNAEVPDIYRIDVASGETLNLSDNPAWDQEPAWSPDGSLIAFTSNRDGNWEIYVMAADGSAVKNVTRHPAVDTSPAWWPG
jgi:TolB protein